MGVTAVLDRIDTLLQDGDVTARRRLPAAFTKMLAWTHDEDEEPHLDLAPTVLYYLLNWDGADGNWIDVISATVVKRTFEARVEFAIYCGGEGTTTEQLQALHRRLGEAYEDAQALLENPNNMNRGATGWLWAKDFRGSPIRADGDRLFKTMTFRVIYRADHTAM